MNYELFLIFTKSLCVNDRFLGVNMLFFQKSYHFFKRLEKIIYIFAYV